jgi:hypothetical protein
MAFVRLKRVYIADLAILRGHQRWRIGVCFDLLHPVCGEEAAEWSSGIVVKDIPTSYGISRALNVREAPLFLCLRRSTLGDFEPPIINAENTCASNVFSGVNRTRSSTCGSQVTTLSAAMVCINSEDPKISCHTINPSLMRRLRTDAVLEFAENIRSPP